MDEGSMTMKHEPLLIKNGRIVDPSQKLNEERDMEVRKISENKEKAFVIWNAKDPDNDNNFLFARHKDLLYSFMIFYVIPQNLYLRLV